MEKKEQHRLATTDALAWLNFSGVGEFYTTTTMRRFKLLFRRSHHVTVLTLSRSCHMTPFQGACLYILMTSSGRKCMCYSINVSVALYQAECLHFSQQITERFVVFFPNSYRYGTRTDSVRCSVCFFSVTLVLSSGHFRPSFYLFKTFHQCCGSVFIESGSEYGSGSSISSESGSEYGSGYGSGSGSESGSRVLMTKHWKKYRSKLQITVLFPSPS